MENNVNKNDDLPLEIEKSHIGNKTALYITGRIDTQTAPEFQEYMDGFFDELDGDLVLDFSDVDYLSSAGLRAILYVQKRMKTLGDDGFNLSIVNVNPAVMEVFEMTGFTDVINVSAK